MFKRTRSAINAAIGWMDLSNYMKPDQNNPTAHEPPTSFFISYFVQKNQAIVTNGVVAPSRNNYNYPLPHGFVGIDV
jgi:hypothetical protein